MKRFVSIIFLMLVLCFHVHPVQGQTLKIQPYAQLLETYVEGNLVDYTGLKEDKEKFEEYLEYLAGIDPETLSRDEQLAFYINVYNAWTLKLIVDNYPGLDSIKDLGSSWNPFNTPWKKEFVRVDGETVTLDHIEHDILRPEFNEPRIHFAINCTALSCPPLNEDPYVGDKIDSQLDLVTRQFINNPERNYLKGNTLYVSKLFDWFGEDFGGEKGIVKFFLKHARGEFKEALKKKKDQLEIEYLEYDWTLNDMKTKS